MATNSAPIWMTYVGMALGGLGAISGVIGAVTGFVSYRKANSLKSLDLRLALRKAVVDLQYGLLEVRSLMELSLRSRTNVSAALGKTNSGEMKSWLKTFDMDAKQIDYLAVEVPLNEHQFNELDLKKIEAELVKMHALQTRLDSIKATYSAVLKKDDEDRKYLRDRVQASTPGSYPRP